MAQSYTEDDVHSKKVAVMGQELGDLHFLLWKDLTWLHLDWHEYRELYGTNAGRVALLNRSAPRFFWHLERILWQDTLLGLSRLADPPGTGGQRNLSFRRFPSLVRASLLNRVTNALDEYEHAAAFARNWRHRRFAHREESYAAKPASHPLERASRAQVEAALHTACSLMNVIELEYENATTEYNIPGGTNGGAYELLRRLDEALASEEVRRGSAQPPWRPRFE